MPPPVGFDFETAKEILRLVKKNKNGSLNRPIDSEIPNLNDPQMVWVYNPANIDCTYDETIKAWLIPDAVTFFGMVAGNDSSGYLSFGSIDADGYIVNSGTTCIAYHIGNEAVSPAPRISKGYHLGVIVALNDSEIPLVLIVPPVYNPPPEFNATMDVVTSVYASAEGIEVTTATLYADASAIISKEFLGLTDVGPDSFIGNGGRVVKVDDTGSFLEFGPIVDAEYTTFIALSDTPASYAGSKADAYKTCIVASDGVSIAFAAADVTTTNSIEGGGNPHHNFVEIQLVGDTASPATDTFYGVDGNGDRAFRTIEITSLSDFPSMVGSGEYFLKVNVGETGIEFVAVDIQQILDDVASLLADVATLQADYITLEARVTALE